MSILDIFRSAPAQQPQQQQQVQQAQGQPQQIQNQHVQNNQTVPNSNTMPPANNGTASNPQGEAPLDKFAGLWDPAKQQGNAAPNFLLNPEQLGQVVSQQDFSKSITPEVASKIMAGGQEAVDALREALNNVGRDVFSRAAQFSGHMTDNGYRVAQQALDRSIPEAIRRQSLTSDLYEKHPQLRSPALQPLVGALTNQFAEKYPNASKREINEMVEEYMGTTVAGAFQKPQDPNTTGAPNKAEDFTSFLG